jgi:ABC-type lipoprotein release transport system permease subunit
MHEAENIERFLENKKDQIIYSKILQVSGYVSANEYSSGFLGHAIESKKINQILNNIEIKNIIPDWIDRSDNYLNNVDNNFDFISITPIMHKKLVSKLNDPVQIISEDFDNSLTVSDVHILGTHTTGLEFKEPYDLITTYEFASKLLKTDGPTYFAIYFIGKKNTSEIIEYLENFINLNQLNLEIVTFESKSWNSYYVGTKYFLYFLVTFFSILILISSCLSVVSFNYLNFEERKNEMGLLGSMGYQNKHIHYYFISECLYVALMSTTLGLFLSFILIQFVNSLKIEFSPPGVSKSVYFMLEPSIGGMCVIALSYLFISIAVSYIISRKNMKNNLNSLLNNSGI